MGTSGETLQIYTNVCIFTKNCNIVFRDMAEEGSKTVLISPPRKFIHFRIRASLISQVLRPTSYGKWVGGPMSLKQGNFSFRARTAHNWLRMGEYGTYLEFCRSEEAPRHCQTSDSPTQSCARAHFRLPPVSPQLAPSLIAIAMKYGFTV